MAACGGKNWGIWPFQLFWTLSFLAESIFLDGCHAKEFIFEVSLNLNFSFSQNGLFCLKIGVGELFNFTRKF